MHFLRHVLGRSPKGSAEMVLAAIGTVFAQLDTAAVAKQLDEIVARLEPRFPKAVKRRTDVVGIFPNEAADARLAGPVLLEIHDEWASAARCYLSVGSMARLDQGRDEGSTKQVERAKTVLLAP